MSDEETTLQALIFQYGETLVHRWALNGERAYLKRKKPKTQSLESKCNAQLKHMSSEQLEILRQKAIKQ